MILIPRPGDYFQTWGRSLSIYLNTHIINYIVVKCQPESVFFKCLISLRFTMLLPTVHNTQRDRRRDVPLTKISREWLKYLTVVVACKGFVS